MYGTYRDCFRHRTFIVRQNLRFETFILQAGTREMNGVTYNMLSFGKVLGILSLKYKSMLRPNSSLCLSHNEERCDVCQEMKDYQYVFVQYYDVLGDGAVPKDGIDN